MATSINWPISLPTTPTVASYSESSGVNILRTAMDAGPAKMRYRGKRPDILNCAFIMTKEQVATLATFVNTTISGVKRFNFTHPRTGSSVEVRLIPTDADQLYTVGAIKGDTFNVAMQLEVMP